VPEKGRFLKIRISPLLQVTQVNSGIISKIINSFHLTAVTRKTRTGDQEQLSIGACLFARRFLTSF